MIRTKPSAFVPFLQDMLARFETDTLYVTVQGVRMRTNEGKKAVNEAITFLKNQ